MTHLFSTTATRPGADESEEDYRPDNGSCSAEVRGDSVTVVSPADPALNVRRGLTVRVVGENRVEVENFIENPGPMLYSCGVWALRPIPAYFPNRSVPKRSGWWKESFGPIGAQLAQCGCDVRSAHL